MDGEGGSSEGCLKWGGGGWGGGGSLRDLKTSKNRGQKMILPVLLYAFSYLVVLLCF